MNREVPSTELGIHLIWYISHEEFQALLGKRRTATVTLSYFKPKVGDELRLGNIATTERREPILVKVIKRAGDKRFEVEKVKKSKLK